MKLCILHTGHPKTGTTSLQHFLASNADRLAEAGLLFPLPVRRKGPEEAMPWGRYNHGNATKTIADRKKSRISGQPVQDLEAALARTPHQVLIISSESLFSELFFRTSSAVPGWFRERGYRIETITYLRDQPDRFNSSYSQQAKTLQFVQTFSDYVLQRTESGKGEFGDTKTMQFGRLVDPAHRIWGEHTFRPFADEVKRIGIEADFLNTMRGILVRHGMSSLLNDARTASLSIPARLNEGDGPVMVEASRRVSEHLADLFGGDPVPQALRTESFRCLSRAIDDLGIRSEKYTGLTPRLYSRIRRGFAATNEKFARAIWGCGWEDVFPTRPRRSVIPNDYTLAPTSEVNDQVEAVVKRVVSMLLTRLEEDGTFWDRVTHERLGKDAKRKKSRAAIQATDETPAGGSPGDEPPPQLADAPGPVGERKARRMERKARRAAALKANSEDVPQAVADAKAEAKQRRRDEKALGERKTRRLERKAKRTAAREAATLDP